MRRYLVKIVTSHKHNLGKKTHTFTIESHSGMICVVNEQIMSLRLGTGESIDCMKVDEIESI